MPRWIALFRGINVGGNNILPMAELKNDLESLNLKNVKTYIQSGNVVFESRSRNADTLGKKIIRQVEERHGFRTPLILLTRPELLAAVSGNPFPEASSNPKTLHFFFMDSTPTNPDIQAIDEALAPTEQYRIGEKVFYLHTPSGMGQSRLAPKVEKHLGVVTTARNFRTVGKLVEMVSID